MTASDEHAATTRKGLIVSDQAVMMGKPVIAGTRITVELILEELAARATPEQLLDAYPRRPFGRFLIARAGLCLPEPWLRCGGVARRQQGRQYLLPGPPWHLRQGAT